MWRHGAGSKGYMKLMWWPVGRCQSGHHQEKAIPVGQDITIAWLADSFRGLIEKSMSICASSSPGCLPARLKSPNEAWSRYLIPDFTESKWLCSWSHPHIGDLRGEFNMNRVACWCCCFAWSCSFWCRTVSRSAHVQATLIACKNWENSCFSSGLI